MKKCANKAVLSRRLIDFMAVTIAFFWSFSTDPFMAVGLLLIFGLLVYVFHHHDGWHFFRPAIFFWPLFYLALIYLADPSDFLSQAIVSGGLALTLWIGGIFYILLGIGVRIFRASWFRRLFSSALSGGWVTLVGFSILVIVSISAIDLYNQGSVDLGEMIFASIIACGGIVLLICPKTKHFALPGVFVLGLLGGLIFPLIYNPQLYQTFGQSFQRALFKINFSPTYFTSTFYFFRYLHLDYRLLAYGLPLIIIYFLDHYWNGRKMSPSLDRIALLSEATGIYFMSILSLPPAEAEAEETSRRSYLTPTFVIIFLLFIYFFSGTLSTLLVFYPRIMALAAMVVCGTELMLRGHQLLSTNPVENKFTASIRFYLPLFIGGAMALWQIPLFAFTGRFPSFFLNDFIVNFLSIALFAGTVISALLLLFEQKGQSHKHQ